MASKPTHRFSTLLVIREVQITISAFSQEWLKWKSQKMSSVHENMEPLERSCHTVGTVNWDCHFGPKNVCSPQGTCILLDALILLLGINATEMYINVDSKPRTRIYMAELFIRALGEHSLNALWHENGGQTLVQLHNGMKFSNEDEHCERVQHDATIRKT